MTIFSEKNLKDFNKTILVAPLDWGLGHAARCIPVIRELQQYPFQIIIAADGAIRLMLEKEFPDLVFITLPGYGIKYSENKRWFRLRILFQFPKILRSIIKEHRWLNRVVQEHKVDAVISDNRLGLFSRIKPSFYITHQLNVKTGAGVVADLLVSAIHQYFIKNYTQCWVPDFEGKKNMAGSLSHTVKLLPNLRYMGCLSRLEVSENSENTIDLLIVLSGPEPQRTLFENLLLGQLQYYQGNVLMVRGMPGNEEKKGNKLPEKIKTVNHLASEELAFAMNKSRLIISRSGYTTIMDLLQLKKKAVLVPTPGQAEQEYLAGYLSDQQMFCTLKQEKFELKKAVEMAASFEYIFPDADMNEYKNFLRRFAETI